VVKTEESVRPLLVRPKRAKQLLDCDDKKLWGLIRSGELASFLDGRARRISVASIEAYIARRLAAPPTSRGRVRRRTRTSNDPQASARGGATT
jgi:hypothetical protein